MLNVFVAGYVNVSILCFVTGLDNIKNNNYNNKINNILFLIFYSICRPISGASMNPARSIGPAIVKHTYKGLWVYIFGPLIGTILGGFAYNLIRFTNKPLRELTKSSSLIRSISKNNTT